MQKSESTKELSTALAKAQGEIKGALKNEANPFFKSKYADLASVVEAIRGPFAKYGLSYVQCVEPGDRALVETILLHASGEWLSCGVLAVPVAKQDAQGFGSALTYARRYSLSAAAGVAPEDDDGNAASGKGGVHKPSDGAMESLSEDGKAAMRQFAQEVMGFMGTGKVKEAVEWIAAANLAADEQVAFWDLLPAGMRTAIKKKQAESKGAVGLVNMAKDPLEENFP